jgi:hypothetical protein
MPRHSLIIYPYISRFFSLFFSLSLSFSRLYFISEFERKPFFLFSSSPKKKEEKKRTNRLLFLVFAVYQNM